MGLLKIHNLFKAYRSGEADLRVFSALDLEVARGEMVAITGPSGTGKSTLLHLIAGLDSPTSGSILYKGRSIDSFSERELAEFRNRELGYVWQHHYLLREFTAEENVMMPLLVRGVGRSDASRVAAQGLADTGLADRRGHRVGELSGGEQQRVAIARALAGSPSLLLADEPTGNLDETTSEAVFELLAGLARARQLTSIIATHNPRFARRCDRALELRAGSLRPVTP